MFSFIYIIFRSIYIVLRLLGGSDFMNVPLNYLYGHKLDTPIIVDTETDAFIIASFPGKIYYNKDMNIYYEVWDVKDDDGNFITHIENTKYVIHAIERELDKKRTPTIIQSLLAQLHEFEEPSQKTNEKWVPHGDLQLSVKANEDIFTSYTNDKGAIPTSCGKENANKQIIIIVKS
jgi:hypothetical protein